MVPFRGVKSARRARASIAATSIALAAAAVSLASSEAHAQVELRCPQGWSTGTPIVPGAPGQRPLVTCRKDPMTVGGLQIDVAVPQGSSEARLALQLLMEAQFPPPDAMPTLRDETLGTVRGRVLEREAQGEGPGGTTTRVTGAVALIPVGGSTVVLRAVSTNARSTALAALRLIVPAVVGIDGAPAQWRVGLTSCPRPLTRGETQGATPNGLRLAGTCLVESEGKSAEVLESRLPARTVADARAAVDFYRQAMDRQFTRLGGRVTMDEPSPITVQGASGFVGAVHAQVTIPESPEGPAQSMRIDRMVAVVPLDNGGHAELVVTLANAASPTAVRSLLDAVIANVKLDGSQVTGSTAPPGSGQTARGDGGAPVGDGGAQSDPNDDPPEQPRRPRVDPNAPIPNWNNVANERPRATTTPGPKSSCGCTTPGNTPRNTAALVSVAAVAAALSARRRRAR